MGVGLGAGRRFSGTERAFLYLATDGLCAICAAPLEPGWHADHVQARSRGGPTQVSNGQALCPPCNLKKGASVIYNDSFQPRPFQADVIEKVLNNHAAGKKVTVVLAAPGSGKTRERAPWLRREVARLLTEDMRTMNPHGGARQQRGTLLPGSDTVERAVARLKRDDPELAARVVAGEVSPNAAARAKGWRKPRIVVSTPASVAVRLRQHFTPQQVAELRALLGEDEP